jgi:hypothetical protein
MDNFTKFIEEQNQENGFTRKPVGEYTFRFGKYRDKTYGEVYDTDKNYVHFVLTKLDPEKNEKLINYYKQRVEEDFA